MDESVVRRPATAGVPEAEPEPQVPLKWSLARVASLAHIAPLARIRRSREALILLSAAARSWSGMKVDQTTPSRASSDRVVAGLTWCIPCHPRPRAASTFSRLSSMKTVRPGARPNRSSAS